MGRLMKLFAVLIYCLGYTYWLHFPTWKQANKITPLYKYTGCIHVSVSGTQLQDHIQDMLKKSCHKSSQLAPRSALRINLINALLSLLRGVKTWSHLSWTLDMFTSSTHASAVTRPKPLRPPLITTTPKRPRSGSCNTTGPIVCWLLRASRRSNRTMPRYATSSTNEAASVNGS